MRTHRPDDGRTKGAEDPYEVCKSAGGIPGGQRLLHAEAVAKVDDPAEQLFDAIEAMDCQELLGAQNGKRLTDLGADLILAALPSSQRQHAHPKAASAAEVGKERIVLVVGVGRDEEDRER